MLVLLSLATLSLQSPTHVPAGAGGGPAVPELNRLWARSFSRSPTESSFTIAGGVYSSARYFLAGCTGSARPWVLSLGQSGGIVWQREYSVTGSTYTELDALAPGYDGGAYIAGLDGSVGAWLAKTDQVGVPIWAKSISQSSGGGSSGGLEIPDLFVVTTDLSGSPAVFLTTNSLTSGGTEDATLIRFDQGGGVLFKKTYVLDPASNGGIEATELAKSLVKTGDGGFYLGLYVLDNTWEHLTVVRAAQDGSIVWSRRIGTIPYWNGSPYLHAPPKISLAYDGGCFVLSDHFLTPGGVRTSVIRLGPDGVPLWGYDYQFASSSTTPFGMAISTTSDGGAYVAGTTLGVSQTNADLWVARLAQDGSVLWSKQFGRPDRNEQAMQAIPTYDGGVYLAAQPAAYPQLPGQQPNWQSLWGIKLWPDGSTAFNAGSGLNVIPHTLQRTPTNLFVQGEPVIVRDDVEAVAPLTMTSTLTTCTVSQQAP